MTNTKALLMRTVRESLTCLADGIGTTSAAGVEGDTAPVGVLCPVSLTAAAEAWPPILASVMGNAAATDVVVGGGVGAAETASKSAAIKKMKMTRKIYTRNGAAGIERIASGNGNARSSVKGQRHTDVK